MVYAERKFLMKITDERTGEWWVSYRGHHSYDNWNLFTCLMKYFEGMMIEDTTWKNDEAPSFILSE